MQASPETMIAAVGFTNEISVDHDGWAQLAPFGDYPGQALLTQPDGSIAKFSALQRLDRAAAEEMTVRFKSPWQRLKRYFTGCPIYAGHPDVPAFGNDYPDKGPKGMIVDLEVRADGLFCKPVFTNEGGDLVESRRFRAFSPYWTAREIGEQAGADGRSLKIYRPDSLKSAGLTNHPNLPVQLLNAAQPESPRIVNSQIILDLLAARGINVAADAGEAEILAGLRQLGERAEVAEAALAARSAELAASVAELANERSRRAAALLDDAVASGRVPAAQRSEWEARLQADFTNESAALAGLAPALKTSAVTLHLGARKAEIANATGRREALDNLVRAEMANNGGDYDRAFAAAQRDFPALFSAMKQPTTN